MDRRFLIARNPDEQSRLPYLLRMPVGGELLVIKARETWPRTAKVYCHRADGEWPEDPEIVEDIGIRSCIRRGVAIDLVLDRRKENRSQFIFTRLKDGREAIFWQTARTTKASRPGIRLPGRRASWLDDFVILVDTRERYPYKFTHQQATVERSALPVGDYGVMHEEDVVGLVERKSLADMAKALIEGKLAFQMADLSTHPYGAVVVEERYASLFKHPYVPGGQLAELVARHQVRYPRVPIVFCDTRPLSEEWTFRFLGAALAAYSEQPDDPLAPKEWVEWLSTE